ncbi:MAG TPA: glycosyltransferase [Planctomycetota bacterium]|nr:glycosyltransferase [Planctomycetota bacterium]
MASRSEVLTLLPEGAAHIQTERSIDGIVAIGRNEGERLRLCLASLSGRARTLVYVDSGSTDGSIALARAAGAQVVQLDLSLPFTAARARNAGFERLLQATPHAEFVQFIDGDCELDPAWLDEGARVLRAEPDVSVVCGRRRERCPAASLYNRLCDVEWDTPIGEARACGGDALVRASDFRLVGGYDPGMIAGEEPDLCLRLRRRGTRILRLDVEMTLHDAAMTSWSQWWQRAVRTGHTTAELLAKHGPTPDHRRLRRALSALTWAVLLPSVWIALLGWALSTSDAAWIGAALVGPPLLYLRPFARSYRASRLAGRPRRDARDYALSCILAKLPETAGMLLYLARRVARRRPRWIEYKDGPRGIEAGSRGS